MWLMCDSTVIYCVSWNRGEVVVSKVFMGLFYEQPESTCCKRHYLIRQTYIHLPRNRSPAHLSPHSSVLIKQCFQGVDYLSGQASALHAQEVDLLLGWELKRSRILKLRKHGHVINIPDANPALT